MQFSNYVHVFLEIHLISFYFPGSQSPFKQINWKALHYDISNKYA